MGAMTEDRAKLTSAERDALPDSAFALPGRRYPIHDLNHAHAALSEVAQHGTAEEKAKVRAAVHRRYPGIKIDGGESKSAQRDPGWEQRRKRWAHSLIGQQERHSLPLVRGNVELRAKPDGTGGTNFEFRGYASTFNEKFPMWDKSGEPYDEDVWPGSFKETLARPDLDTPFLIGHREDDIALARTRSGTMRLGEDSHGLDTFALLSGRNSRVRDLADAMDRGDMDEMSIGFITRGQKWSDDYMQRHLTKIDLHRGDVSVVALAANPATRGANLTAFPTEILSRQAAEQRAAAPTTDDPDSDHMMAEVGPNHGDYTGVHIHEHDDHGSPNHMAHEHEHQGDHAHNHHAMSMSADMPADDRGSNAPRELRGNPVDISFGDAADYNGDYNPDGAVKCQRATCPAGPNGSMANTAPGGKFCSWCGDALVRIDDQGVPGMEEESGEQAALSAQRQRLQLLVLAGRR